MSKVKAEGQLIHKFHGTYFAVVGLIFRFPSEATSALPVLGEKWKLNEKNPCVAFWQGTSEELEILKKDLDEKFHRKNVPCGRKHCKTKCKNAPIDHINHSVDVGASFEIEIECSPEEQLNLIPNS